MSKLISELRASDVVMVRLGAKTQRDENTGRDIVIDPEKVIDVPFSYWETVTHSVDEYVAETGYYKPIGRTVELLGLAGYATQTNYTGDTFSVASVIPFETPEGRAQKQEEARQAELARQEADRQAEITRQADLAQQEVTRQAQLAQEKADKEAAEEAKKAQKDAEKKAKKDADDAAKAAQTANTGNQ